MNSKMNFPSGSKLFCLAFAVIFSLALLGCSGKGKGASGKRYTYHAYSSVPQTWNPTDYSLGDEATIISLTNSSLYDFVMNEAQNGYDIVPEMAESSPVDVTAEYAGKEPYGVPSDATSGWAWKISLIKNAKWDNGSPIDAGTYEYTLKQFLNPEMKNYRANSFYQDGLPLANAKAYYDGTVSWENVCTDAKNQTYLPCDDSEMYISLTAKCVFFDSALANIYSTNPEYFADGGSDLYPKLSSAAGNSSYAKLTPEVKKVLQKVAANCGDKRAVAYKEFCFVRKENPPMPWEKVGFVKNDDYTFTLILNKQLTPFMFYYAVSSISLVREDLYEANKQKTGDIVKTSYCTSAEKSASCGPYKVTEFQADKYIHLEKNENWYGWTDGRHKGQYQTTGYDIQFITDLETLTNLFLQGKLDALSLDAVRMEKFGNSEYRIDAPQSYTWKFSFNMDKRALKAEETAGVNRSILSYLDFRKGISLCIDRQKYVDTISIGSDPGFGLINYMYVAEPESGLLYRDTPQAKKALCEFYGTSSVEDITGYNREEAASCFQKAYDAAIAAGDLKATDKIQIDYHIYSESDINKRTVAFLQEAINSAAKGTSLEGKVIINAVVDENYYTNMKSGKVDLAMTGWGGSSFDPYGILWCYCDEAALSEYGFHPERETLTINIEGKDYTKTYNEWYMALCNGEYTAAPIAVKNTILASVEKALLGYYNMIPVRYMNSASLDSQRIIEGSDHYINQLVGFGGIRFMTYTMDDEEWDSYCKENNYQLKY